MIWRDFLQKTDPEPLHQLIKISEASYFKKLLQACSAHVRYQLAVENSLNPIIRFLPIEELKIMVQAFIQPQGLGIYRDHMALLHLIEALNQRATANPGKKATIFSLQKHLLERGPVFHQETNHIHVVSEIEGKLNRVLAASKKEQAKESSTKEAEQKLPKSICRLKYKN